MFQSVPLVLLALLGIVACTDVYITSPYDIIVWKLGKQETVTWNILPGGPVIEALDVDLMDGEEISANVICNIARGLPITATSATWVVPNTLAPGKNYFVRVSSPNLALQRFSHRFTIDGAQCSTKTSSSSSAASSSASATSKASQSTGATGTASKGTATSSGASSEATVTRTVTSNVGMSNHNSASSNFVAAAVIVLALLAML